MKKHWTFCYFGSGGLDLPVMGQAITRYREQGGGLTVIDGSLITIPFATREQNEIDPITGGLLTKLMPIADRVKKLASMSIHWARLKGKSNSEKNVAIVKETSLFLSANETESVSAVVGKPLLFDFEDTGRVARALLDDAPEQREESDALVFMGHGSAHHPSDFFYEALAAFLIDLDKRAFLGTVEGELSIEDIVRQCKEAGCEKAWLIPFMAAAGDHAVNDMAGDDEDSWKSILGREGIEGVPILRGILDCAGIRDVWLDHLAEIGE